ncbi:MAG: hypothetical protein F6K11_34960, partial [Leptolyngbya sp. SIO3F4]|nr:hypothetical protein [Leptolyngbya sp. SIO3F4]
ISFDFGGYFGQKECYPAQMKEIIGIDKELGLKDCAVYAAGFDAYIDRFIFPLAVILGFFSRKFSLKVCSKLFYDRIKAKIRETPKAKIVLRSRGRKLGREKEVRIGLFSENSFELTAMAITALLKQYMDGPIKGAGLYLMGQIVNEERLFKDLVRMGVKLKTEQIE